MRTPADQRDPARIEEQRLAALATMRILDDHLAGRDYLGGAAFTVGDIAAGCAAWRWFALPIAREALPHLQRWFERLAERPAFRKTVMTPLTT
jgi:glutathione S-transferase